VTTVLRAVVDRNGLTPGQTAAGKTGSQQWANTKDSQDAWMVGYTPQLATAVWIGRAVPGPIRDSANHPINGETLPAQLWKSFLQSVLRGAPGSPFPAPAHVGRTDVGDAGRLRNPDHVSNARVAQGVQPVVHTAHQGRSLALTFDDGPSEYTPQVLDILAKYHIKATFCVVGDNVAEHPATMRRIVGEGHTLCNHSTHHDDLGGANQQQIAADIATTDTAITAACPGATITYFRAPYGDWGKSAKIAADLGHTPLGWLVDPEDWARPGTNQIITAVLGQLRNRAVVLLHFGGGDRQQTVDALNVLIPRLLAQGWTFDRPEITVHTRVPDPAPSPPTAAAGSRTSPSPPSGPSPSSSATVTPPEAEPGDH
jgi:peptidoglycan/xylan/chitin deacetylase (PgdA/CDA1 family)